MSRYRLTFQLVRQGSAIIEAESESAARQAWIDEGHEMAEAVLEETADARLLFVEEL